MTPQIFMNVSSLKLKFIWREKGEKNLTSIVIALNAFNNYFRVDHKKEIHILNYLVFIIDTKPLENC